MSGAGVRRIVTGHDADGNSIVVMDGATPHVKSSPHRPGVKINNLWMTDRMPADAMPAGDAAAKPMQLEPVANGVNFRVVEFPPETEYIASISAEDARKAFGDMGAGHALAAGAKSRHPYMHKTKTLDFAVVLSGEIYLVLDKDERLMRAGDVCIQCATNHAWSNRSSAPARIAFLLIDGETR